MTYNETKHTLDKKKKKILVLYSNFFSLLQRVHEVREIKNTSKSLLLKNMRTDILAIDITMKNVRSFDTNKNELTKFIKKSFLSFNIRIYKN